MASIRQHRFQTRAALVFHKRDLTPFQRTAMFSPCTVLHENWSKAGKTLQETFWIILPPWSWPKSIWQHSRMLEQHPLLLPVPCSRHRCHQSNFVHRTGQPGRLGKLLGKDIKSIFRDLIPIVVLPKLFPDSILRLLQAALDGDLWDWLQLV